MLGYDIQSIESFVDNTTTDELRKEANWVALGLKEYSRYSFGAYVHDSARRTKEYKRVLDFFRYVDKVRRTEEVVDLALKANKALSSMGIDTFHSRNSVELSQHEKVFRPYYIAWRGIMTEKGKDRKEPLRHATSVIPKFAGEKEVTVSELIEALSTLDSDDKVIIARSSSNELYSDILNLKIKPKP